MPLVQARLLQAALSHIEAIATLPRHHGDPFDRVIISPAIVDDFVIVSADVQFDAYPIVRRW